MTSFHEPVSELDQLMLRWMAKSPNRCKPAFGDQVNVLSRLKEDADGIPDSIRMTNKKSYLVFAPNMEQYVNVKAPGASWDQSDWKSVNIGELVETQPMSMGHLAMGVVEALKAEGLYDRQLGLPVIRSFADMYPVVYRLLNQLVTKLESKKCKN